MRTRTRTILAGLVLAAALVGGVAWATIPGSGGTIQGCYTTGNGNLRVVDSADECRNSETAISWNQKGPKGEPGAAGANGTNGTNGAAGAKGETGAAGTNGAAGAKGETGDTGPAGANGTNGAAGAKGETGAAGTNGAAGAKGDPCLATDPACVGPAGPAGTATTTYTTRSAASNTTLAHVICLEGERVTGGGGSVLANSGAVVESFPVGHNALFDIAFPASGTNARGWRLKASEGSSGVSVYVICAS